MLYTNTQLFTIAASLIACANAASTTDGNAFLIAFLTDVKGNLNDYLSYVQTNAPDQASGLVSLYEQAATYTDTSYTTLVDDAEVASLSAFATALPWYSTRLEPEIAAEEASLGGGATTSEAAATTSEAAATSSEAAETTSAAMTSEAAETTTAAPATSEAAESSAPAVETMVGAGAIAGPSVLVGLAGAAAFLL